MPTRSKSSASTIGTRDNPWQLKTPPGSSEFVAFRDEALDPPALVVQVGKTELRYHLRCIEDLHAMLKAHGDWMPLGAGQFQNGDRAKGTAIAAGQIVLGLVNISAIVFHNQIAEDRTRTCISGQPGCSNPPYFDSDRALLSQVDAVKYVSAGLFWALYAYGVWDAHRNYVPRLETEITPARAAGSVKLEWTF